MSHEFYSSDILNLVTHNSRHNPGNKILKDDLIL